MIASATAINPITNASLFTAAAVAASGANDAVKAAASSARRGRAGQISRAKNHVLQTTTEAMRTSATRNAITTSGKGEPSFTHASGATKRYHPGGWAYW